MAAKSFFDLTASHWKDIYSAPGVYAGIYRARREAVLALADGLRLPKGARVLDVGCGPGLTAVALARRGFVVHTVDLIDKMLRVTTAEAAQAGLSAAVRPAVADAGTLPFQDASFDLVLAVGIMEWMDALEPVMREIARVARPGAHVILTTDNRWALHHVLDPLSNPLVTPLIRLLGRLLDRVRRRAGVRPKLHSIAGFDAAAASSGLRKLRGFTLGFGPFTFLRLPLLSERLGWALHRRLQALADRGAPLLRSGGQVYLVLTYLWGGPPGLQPAKKTG